jgi:hypothetical protein
VNRNSFDYLYLYIYQNRMKKTKEIKKEIIEERKKEEENTTTI